MMLQCFLFQGDGLFVEKAVFAGAFQIRSLELTVVLEHCEGQKFFRSFLLECHQKEYCKLFFLQSQLDEVIEDTRNIV